MDKVSEWDQKNSWSFLRCEVLKRALWGIHHMGFTPSDQAQRWTRKVIWGSYSNLNVLQMSSYKSEWCRVLHWTVRLCVPWSWSIPCPAHLSIFSALNSPDSSNPIITAGNIFKGAGQEVLQDQGSRSGTCALEEQPRVPDVTSIVLMRLRGWNHCLHHMEWFGIEL